MPINNYVPSPIKKTILAPLQFQCATHGTRVVVALPLQVREQSRDSVWNIGMRDADVQVAQAHGT